MSVATWPNVAGVSMLRNAVSSPDSCSMTVPAKVGVIACSHRAVRQVKQDASLQRSGVRAGPALAIYGELRLAAGNREPVGTAGKWTFHGVAMMGPVILGSVCDLLTAAIASHPAEQVAALPLRLALVPANECDGGGQDCNLGSDSRTPREGFRQKCGLLPACERRVSVGKAVFENWWLWVDLNHRPQHYECRALTS